MLTRSSAPQTVSHGWTRSTVSRRELSESVTPCTPNKEHSRMSSGQRLSTCCGAPVHVGGGSGPTHYYVCSRCGKACDTRREPGAGIARADISGRTPGCGHGQLADPCVGVVAASGTEGSMRGLRGCQMCCACPSDPRVACRRARPALPLARSARVVVGLRAVFLRARRSAWPCTTLPNGLSHPGKVRGGGRRTQCRWLLPLFLIALALAGCAPKQESEAISKSGNQFLEEEKREAPKVEQATREIEALGRKAHEERQAMEAKGEWPGG